MSGDRRHLTARHVEHHAASLQAEGQRDIQGGRVGLADALDGIGEGQQFARLEHPYLEADAEILFATIRLALQINALEDLSFGHTDDVQVPQAASVIALEDFPFHLVPVSLQGFIDQVTQRPFLVRVHQFQSQLFVAE